MKTTQTWL